MALLTSAISSPAATIIDVTSSVTAGAGNAYDDDELLNITATGSVDFSPEDERFGSVQGVAGSAITLGSRAIILVGDAGFAGDRFGTGFFGTLTGSASSEVEKRNSGTLTFGTAGLDGFSGTFNITGGILALETASGVTDTVTHRFDGSGAFHKTGDGTLILGNASNSAAYMLSPHSGAINIDAGKLVFDTTNGNFSLSHSTLGGVGTLGIQGGGPTKYLTLSGDSDAGTEFTGDIHIANTGHLRAGADDSLGDQNAIAIDSGGTLTLIGAEGFGSLSGGGTFDVGSNDAGVGADNADTRFTGLLKGSGDLTKNGAGTWTLGSSSRNLVPLLSGFSGNLIATGGILAIDPSNASFTLNHSLLGGSGTLGISGNSSNTVTLAGDWDATTNFTGDIHVFSSGRLVAGANDSLGDSNAVQIDSGGKLTLAAGEGFGSVSGSGTFDLQTFSGEVGADNASTTFDGTLLGSGPLTKNGTGTWTLGDVDTLPSEVLGGHTGTFTIAGGTVALHTETNDGTALSNAFLGSGNLQKTGDGSLTLTGLTNAFTGNYQLDAGTLVVDTTGNALSIDHSNLRSGSETTLAVAGDGTNTLTLTGDWDTGDDFDGDIQILEDGRLVVGANDSLGDGNDVQIDAGGRLTLAEGEGFGTLTGAGIFDLSGHSGEVTVEGGETATFSGQITGTAGSALTKNGPGSWILSGISNDYDGDTTVNAGTLTLGTSGVIPDASDITVNASGTLDVNGNSEIIATLAGAGAVTLGGGTLTTDSSDSTTFSGVMSEAGIFTKAGTGTLTLTGANTFTGPTTISDGTLRIGSGGSLQSTITNNANLLFDRSGTLDQTAIISGTGDLTKSGSGTVTLSAANTYTGDTTVTAGTLQLGASERIADTSDLVVNGGTFDLNDFTETLATISGTGGTIDLGSGTLASTNATAQTYNGNITGSGTFQKLGDGTLTLGGENTLTGTLDIDAGTLALAAGNVLDGATVDLSSTATLDISAEDEGFDVLKGSGFVNLGGSELILGADDDTMTYNGIISGTGGLEKRGQGNLFLTGNNTYTGTTEITEGTLRLFGGHLSNSSTVDVSSGAFFNAFDQTTTIGGLKGSGGVYMGNGTLSSGANNTNTTYSGFLNTGSNGTFAKVGTGTLTLTGLSLNLENTRVEAGTLSIGNGSNNGLYGDRQSSPEGLVSMIPSNTTISAGATLALHRSDDFRFFTDDISGDGTFAKQGNNTIDFWGTGQQLGLLNVADGRIDIVARNSIHNNTPVNVASGAVLDIGNLNVSVGALSGGGEVIIHEFTLASGSGSKSPPTNFTVNTNGQDSTFTGKIRSRVYAAGTGEFATSSVGSLTKTGAGTLTLDTEDVAVRTIFVKGGTLKFGTGDVLSNTQRVDLSGTGILDFTAEGEAFGNLYGTGGTVRLGSSGITLGRDDANASFGGSITNFTDSTDTSIAAMPGDVTKEGLGRFTIYGDLATTMANFIGDFHIDEGTLAFFTEGQDNFSIAADRIHGTAKLSKRGNGTMTLTGAPANFTGDYEIETGTLAFDLSSGFTVSIASDRLNGAGTLKKSGDGTLTMDGGDGGFTGDIEVADGTFKSGGGGNSLSDSTSIDLVSGSSFVLTGDEQFGGITGTGGEFDLAGFEGNIGYDNATSALFSGSITSTGGGGNIIKAGTGKLTLSGTSTYTGGTEIRAGTLALGASNILPNIGNFHVNGGIFGLDTFSDTVGPVTLTSGSITGTGTLTSSSYAVKSGTLSARLRGSGGLTKTTSGTVTLSGNNSSFSGPTTVTAGTLQTGDANALGTGAVTVSGGTLNLGGNTDSVGQVTLTSGTISNGTLSSSAGFDVRSGAVSAAFAGSGALTKSTSGTVTLSGNNTYTGDTTVTAGTLRIGTDDALRNSNDLVINAGTFDLDDHTDTVRSLAGSGGTLDLGSGTLLVNPSSSTTFHGNITGSGTFAKYGNGTLTLAGENGLTGTLDIQDGKISLGPGDTSATDNALGSSATVNVGPVGTFNVAQQDEGFGTLTGSGTVEFGNDSDRILAVSDGSFIGTFIGVGDFRHAGSGTYTLSTANLSGYSGELVSESGTLALDSGSGSHSLSNAITGSGDLQKIGTGTLTLSGLTTGGFTGNYQLDAGTLAIDTSNADLAITHDDLSGAANATLQKVDTGTLTLSGDWDTGDDFESAVTVANGTLAFGAGDVLSNSAVVTLANDATLDLSTECENFGNLTGSGSVTLGSEGIGLGGNNSPSTFSGNISGNGGSLTKSGSAMLTLSGTNTYTGGTTINGGTLRLSGGSALADTGAVVLANTSGATLDLNNSNETIGSLSGGGSNGGNVTLGTGTLTVGSGTFNGEIGAVADTGGLTKVGPGNLTLNGTSHYQGDTTVDGGTLTLGHATNTLHSNSSVMINNGTTLAIGSNSDTVGAIILNSGSITGTSGTLTGSSYTVKSGTVSAKLGTGALTKTTGGTVTLSGENALSNVNIQAGTLALAAGDILNETATVHLTGGTLDISAEGEQIGNLSGSGGTVALDSQRLTVGLNNAPSTFNGALIGTGSGTGELRKVGTSTFTLGTANLSSFNGSIDLATDGLALSSTNGASNSFGGTITGAGNLTKSGAGTLVLTGGNTYTGGTIFDEGTLKVGSAGAINSTGVLTFTGGTLQYGSVNQTDYSSRFSTANNQAFSIDTNGQTVTFATSLISTGGSLTKKGVGTLTLANNNKYTGGTFLEGGTLIVGNNKAFDDGSVTMAGGTTLSSNDNNRSIDNTMIVNGNVSFGGSDLELGGNVDLGGGTRSLSIDNSVTEIRGIISNGGLTKTGAGTLRLEGNNTYTGDTVVTNGTLRISSGSAISDAAAVTVQGGTLDLTKNETVGTVHLDSGNITGSHTLTSNAAFNVESGTISANLAGSAALTKTTNVVVTLSGTNTYNGGTTINSGTLRLSGGSALSDTGAVVLADTAGATLDLNDSSETIGTLSGSGSNGGNVTLGSGNLTVSGGTFDGEIGALNDYGGLTKTGSGNLTLNGTNLYRGATTINGGTLTLGNASNTLRYDSAISINNGATLAIGSNSDAVGAVTLNSGHITGSGTLFSNDAFNVKSGIIAANLAGNAALTKTTTGVVTLSGTNNRYAGGTFVQEGVLRLSGGSALSNIDPVVLADTAGATLDLNDSSETIGALSGGGSNGGNVTLGSGTLTVNSGTFNGEIGAVSDTGGLTKIGSGNLTLNGTSRYQGATTINGGTLTLGNASNTLRANSAISINNDATLAIGSNSDAVGAITLNSGHITGSGTLTSNAAFNVKSGTISAKLAGSAALTKTTTGVVTLSGTNNTYSGDTFVQEGVLRLGSAGALSPNTTLNVSPGARFEANGHATSFAQLNGTGDIDFGSGGLTVTPTSGTNTFAGRLIGGGNLIKNGAGTLELSGTHTFTGETRINAGRLRLTGSAASSAFRVNDGGILSGSGTLGALTIASGGTIAPGNSPGTMNAGNTIWESGGNFSFEIDNATGSQGSNWDLLAISGTLTINALVGTPFTIDVDTLISGTDTAGAMANFDADTNHEWIFVTTTGGISFGENASVGASFAIDTTDFANTTNGTFAVALANAGQNLALTYTTSAVPEPSTIGLLLGFMALGYRMTSRRAVRRRT
ncbi:MAG: autotransporter BatB [Synoicihabitans sp.]